MVGIGYPVVDVDLACRIPISEACVWGKAYFPQTVGISVVVLGAWRILSVVAFPFLSLEAVAHSRSIDRAPSILTLVVLFIAALVLDGFIASRFDSNDALANESSSTAVRRDR